MDKQSNSAFQIGPEWCLPISVSEIDDFQTELQTEDQAIQIDRKFKQERKSQTISLFKSDQIDEARNQIVDGRALDEEGAGDNKDWFRPQAYNQFKLITRVIIASSEDKNTTNLVIIDEPAYEDYVIINDTDFKVHFMKHDQDENQFITFSDSKAFQISGLRSSDSGEYDLWSTVGPRSKKCFVWNNRDIRVKNVSIKINDDKKYTFNLDKQSTKKVIYEKRPDLCEAQL